MCRDVMCVLKCMYVWRCVIVCEMHVYVLRCMHVEVHVWVWRCTYVC